MSDALHDDGRCAPRQFVQGGFPLGALARYLGTRRGPGQQAGTG